MGKFAEKLVAFSIAPSDFCCLQQKMAMHPTPFISLHNMLQTNAGNITTNAATFQISKA